MNNSKQAPSLHQQQGPLPGLKRVPSMRAILISRNCSCCQGHLPYMDRPVLVMAWLQELLLQRMILEGVLAIQGNYDESVGSGRTDCGCGYTDPRDNHYAAISYRYTFEHTSAENRAWLGALPRHRRLKLGPHRALMCHGSPRVVNEFLWESTSPDGFLRYLLDDADADVLCVTHTGIKWHRDLGGGRHVVNVGALGRPGNDGTPLVWYALLTIGATVDVEFIPIHYDHEALAADMHAERLPG